MDQLGSRRRVEGGVGGCSITVGLEDKRWMALRVPEKLYCIYPKRHQHRISSMTAKRTWAQHYLYVSEALLTPANTFTHHCFAPRQTPL